MLPTHPFLLQGWYHRFIIFPASGFRIRMGWAANSASRHPDSTSIRASTLQPIAFISLSLDLVASRRPKLILEKDSSVQKLEHHSHSQHNILGRKSWNWEIQMIIRHKSNCLEIFVNYLVMIFDKHCTDWRTTGEEIREIFMFKIKVRKILWNKSIVFNINHFCHCRTKIH